MITLSTFQEYLSSTEPLPPLNRPANGQDSYLLKLLDNLSSQTQVEQAEQLEKILNVLCVANIDEQQRLELVATVIGASDKLIATLRQGFIYEIGALSDIQLGYINQIKSLYYLTIMVYDRVIRHTKLLLGSQRKHTISNGWQRYFNGDKASSTTLAIAIYQTLLMYQRLLFIEALCYRKPSPYLWSNINKLYYLAYQYHAAETDLSKMVDAQHANSVHRLYCQICLHSLLNVRAMRRPNILLVQRLLPKWTEYVVATIEPKTETPLFVDLQSDKPPTHLTARSEINPYEDRYSCLFIQLVPMLEYFDSRSQALIKQGKEGVESHLLNRVTMTLNYRYLHPQPVVKAKTSTKKEAILIVGFNNIHYRVSHSHSFARLIATNELPLDERPRYDTVSEKHENSEILINEMVDGNDGLLFRTLQLPSKAGILNKENHQQNHDEESINVVITDDAVMTAPLPLHIMSLFLIYRFDTGASSNWTMGIVRWLDTDIPEVDWQVLGCNIVACGLRSEGRETRSQHFVPAFILGRDEQLQTISTLIVPTSYFQTNDKVVMRIGNKQTLLRLGRRLLITDEFSQYEIVQI